MAFFYEFPHTRTYDDDLGWLIKVVKEMIQEINNIETKQNKDESDIAALQQLVQQLQQILNDITAGKYSSLYIEALTNWLNGHMPQIISSIVKYVFFGLSDDGHFVAYIPPTWNFIQFDTVMDSTSELYGHLVLKW